MGGYRPKRTLYRLRFEDPEMDGLEVTCKGTTIGGLLELAEMAEGADPETLDLSQARDLFAPFARLLVSWNVEDDEGRPVPATLDGLLDQEIPFVTALITAYVAGMTQAPPPLSGPSGSGGTTPEVPPVLASASRPLQSSSAPG